MASMELLHVQELLPSGDISFVQKQRSAALVARNFFAAMQTISRSGPHADIERFIGVRWMNSCFGDSG
jgi:hypothetical protein